MARALDGAAMPVEAWASDHMAAVTTDGRIGEKIRICPARMYEKWCPHEVGSLSGTCRAVC